MNIEHIVVKNIQPLYSCNLYINPLTSGECGSNFKYVIFKHILVINIQRISHGTCTTLRWIPKDLIDDMSTLFSKWLGAIRHQGIFWTNVDHSP